MLYTRCPTCGEDTTRYKNVSPLDADEARSLLLHAEFNRYYEKRCNRRGIPVEGPLPDPDAADRLLASPGPAES